MRCERVDALLPAYLDGDLPSRLNRSVSDHLDLCERCRRELAAQQRALQSLDSGRHPVTIDLWADFSRRLQAQSPPPAPLWLSPRRPGLAAALAATAIAVAAFMAPRPPPISSGSDLSPYTQMAAAPRREKHPLPGRVPAEPRTDAVRAPAALSMRRPDRMASSSDRPRWRLRRLELRHGGLAFTRPSHRPRSQRGLTLENPTSPVNRTLTIAERPEPSTVLRGIGFQGSARPSDPGQILPPPTPPQAGTHLAASRRSDPAVSGGPARSGDPLKLAEALVSIEQDAASDQMKGELLRMAQEVARVGGEAGVESQAGAAGRSDVPADDPHSSLSNSSGG